MQSSIKGYEINEAFDVLENGRERGLTVGTNNPEQIKQGIAMVNERINSRNGEADKNMALTTAFGSVVNKDKSGKNILTQSEINDIVDDYIKNNEELIFKDISDEDIQNIRDTGIISKKIRENIM